SAHISWATQGKRGRCFRLQRFSCGVIARISASSSPAKSARSVTEESCSDVPYHHQEVIMTMLSALWLPIVLSAVIVFVVSSIIHMATPWHKGDYLKAPDEDKVMDALRSFNIPPGDYMMPRPSSVQDMKSPEFMERRSRGPVMVFTVMPGRPVSMG